MFDITKEVNSLFKPVETKRIFKEISEQLKELICEGVFRPGDRLPSERELGERFRAGRLAVREALRTLEEAGFIYIRKGSKGGAIIRETGNVALTRSFSDVVRRDKVTITQLTEMRLGVERMVIELAIERGNSQDILALKQNLKKSELAFSKGLRSAEINIDFHILISCLKSFVSDIGKLESCFYA